MAYVGDVVGTGSSRKSATNSVLWFTGEDIPYVPNKRFGGVCLGSKIAPIFYNTMEDAGALPIELDVSQMETGDVVELRAYDGKALKNGKVIAEFTVKSDVIFDEVRAGGRIPLIVGRGLTAKAREEQKTVIRSFSKGQGEMPFPARGRIVVKFGESAELGAPSRGISIETRPAAQVVAPYDGQVVFAGPCRGSGLLLIIEHGEGYHTLLAGMARIDGTVGQRLRAGEPVGVMGESEGRPLLYVELRHNGQPVNPLHWLTARNSKVPG